MIEEEIIEGNRLIAEFMGGIYKSNNFNIDDGWIWLPFKNMCKISNLQYHYSWDWLFSVLEKIEALGYRWEIGTSPKIDENRYHYCKIWSIGTIEGISPIDAVYGACIEFIKWFNGTQNDNKTTTSTE